MLLVIDVGNSHSVFGLYRGRSLVQCWRLSTSRHRTSDEYGILVRQLFETAGLDPGGIEGCIIACVVPPMLPIVVEMVKRYADLEPLVVGPGIRTGMPILMEQPREVGADRIVNAVAAYDRVGDAVIVVDFGTATTFDAVSGRGEYLGGIICPGIAISAEALFQRASKLPRVEIVRPSRVIGRNTVACIQSGLVFGYVGLIEGLVTRIREEAGAPEMKVIATGGLSRLFAEESSLIDAHDENLTLSGLRLLHERNVRDPE
ncbi:MAG: type III pantothenate kinase [Deltaproteobacteria bacterium]|nr:MAG: type III pantothenate kinase [Deltaproteobacteria bacterium]